jgi:hypothetical protein
LSEIVMRPGSQIAVPFRVTNLSPISWEHDGYACIALGNHWLDDCGNLVRLDDGRAPLPVLLSPNDSVERNLQITAPPRPGRYLLELDVVQEGIGWFADKGSATLRLPVRVGETIPDEMTAQPREATAEIIPAPQATFQDVVREDHMHCIPRADVLQLLRSAGGYLEFIQPSGCSGPGFQSYLYFVRKGDYSAASSPLRDDQV